MNDASNRKMALIRTGIVGAIGLALGIVATVVVGILGTGTWNEETHARSSQFALEDSSGACSHSVRLHLNAKISAKDFEDAQRYLWEGTWKALADMIRKIKCDNVALERIAQDYEKDGRTSWTIRAYQDKRGIQTLRFLEVSCEQPVLEPDFRNITEYVRTRKNDNGKKALNKVFEYPKGGGEKSPDLGIEAARLVLNLD